MRKARLFLAAFLTLVAAFFVINPAQAAVTTHWSAWKWVDANSGWMTRVHYVQYPAGGNYYRFDKFEVKYDGQSSSTANFRSARITFTNLNTYYVQTFNKNSSTWKTGDGPYTYTQSVTSMDGTSNPMSYVTLWTGTTAGTGYVGGAYVAP